MPWKMIQVYKLLLRLLVLMCIYFDEIQPTEERRTKIGINNL